MLCGSSLSFFLNRCMETICRRLTGGVFQYVGPEKLIVDYLVFVVSLLASLKQRYFRQMIRPPRQVWKLNAWHNMRWLHTQTNYLICHHSMLDSHGHNVRRKPAEARIAKWQEQWEQTDSNLKRYNINPKERLPSGHTLPWRAWRTSNRVRSGQAATPAAKHMWGYRDSKNCMCGAATCDLNHIMTSCTHFGERPCLDDIAGMKDGYVRWLRAIADTIWWWMYVTVQITIFFQNNSQIR